MQNEAEATARLVRDLERRLRNLERSTQLGSSSIESASLDVYSGDDLVQVVGIDGDQPVFANVDSTPPVQPNPPTVEALPSALVVRFDGTYAGTHPVAVAAVQVHLTEIAGEAPSGATYRSAVPVTGGAVIVPASPEVATEVRLVAVSPANVSSEPSEVVEAEALPVVVAAEIPSVSDGDPPNEAPVVVATSPPGFGQLSWLPVENPDPILGYKVYVSATPGFTADATNLQQRASGTLALLRSLPSGASMTPGAPYFARVRAYDADGDGPLSDEVELSPGQSTGPDIAAGSINATMLQSVLNLASVFVGKQPPSVLVEKSLTSNIATLETVEPHNLDVGAVVTITGVDGTFNGLRTITAVPSATELSFPVTAADVPATATTGLADPSQRWEGDRDGIRFYDMAGNLVINLPTNASPDNPPVFYGSLVAVGLRVLDNFALAGDNNELSAGATLVLRSGITPPSISPSPEFTYSAGIRWDYSEVGGNLGAVDFDGTDWWGARGDGSDLWLDQLPVAGGPPITSIHLPGNWDDESATRLVKLGNYVYVEYSDDGFSIDRWDLNNLGAGSSAAPGGSNDRLGVDHVNGHLIISHRLDTADGGTGELAWTVYDPDDGTVVSSHVSNFKIFGTYEAFPVDGHVADFGGARFLVDDNKTSTARVFTTAAIPVEQQSENFPTIPEAASFTRSSIIWDGTRFVSLDEFGTNLLQYSMNTWTVETNKWWAGATWRDPDGTAPDFALSETELGKVVGFTMRKRADLSLTVPQLPTDALTFYVGRLNGTTAPANTQMWRQPPPAAGVRAQALDDAILSGSSPVDNPPTTNTFPDGAPSRVLTQNGGAELDSEGHLTVPKKAQAGTETIVPAAANTAESVTVEFLVPFDEVPVVTATPGEGAVGNNAVGTVCDQKTETGFRLTLIRGAAVATEVNWTAIVP